MVSLGSRLVTFVQSQLMFHMFCTLHLVCYCHGHTHSDVRVLPVVQSYFLCSKPCILFKISMSMEHINVLTYGIISEVYQTALQWCD